MKKLFLLLSTIALSATTYAQGNFHAEDGKLVWEREIQSTNADVVTILDREPNLKITGLMDNVYKGVAFNITPNCPDASALLKNECKFEFFIIVNPESYVVKIENFKMLEHYGPMGARVMANRSEKYYLDSDGKMRNDADTINDLNNLDRYLNAIFALPAASQQRALTSNKK
ncbi:hypothetical protein [Flavobacterium rhizosphaerae]|uniref:DUF4468 domain-containing protein n=1 Tax=Flavobacterium rhizosphaerae TaxID=3163298 RepID=A0ABW8YVA2_9FLAO